jgi:hypothetical protein
MDPLRQVLLIFKLSFSLRLKTTNLPCPTASDIQSSSDLRQTLQLIITRESKVLAVFLSESSLGPFAEGGVFTSKM